MGKGGVFDRILNRDRDKPSQVQFQSVTPNVYTPEEYTQQVSQPGPQYMPAQFEFNPYAQAYLNQLNQLGQPQQFQPQQFQQALSPNLSSGLAALAEAYGIANPLAPTAPASAPAASTTSTAE
jgi:hypothetical protein